MRIDWYFDFISPFAFLQWPAICTLAPAHEVVPRPLLLAALLDQHGHKGPAEIPAKRRFTYRHVQFQAERMGVPLRFPPAHPFNPLAALRLCIAAGQTAQAVSAIFDWIWIEGRTADSVDALRPLAARLGIADPDAALADPVVKQTLRSNGEAALAAGIFGVPTAVVAGELFWGLDATPMLDVFLADPELFRRGEMARLDCLPAAATRG
ncbi:MAG TPA: 2-hydroxychromene-2-carboxylate isomerase [Xanthomonadaceae bacterium]|nr:2-hydroxychromene-2-carboxylate isomerase [Xanthomonadaceae bacterium]